jgi:diguanylate cyclase (GGDEF)-like protein/PAS domain S-box-containing protein
MANQYSKWTKEDLIKKIYTLEEQLKKVLDSNNDSFLVEFPWAGNLGQWHWLYDQNKVVFNDKKISQLGYDPLVVGEVGFEFFTEKLHPDDYENVMQNMRDHLSGKTKAYEVEYRIRHKNGHYLWYYDRGTVTKRESNGKPLILQGIVFDISESKKIETELIHLSERDALTHTFNRRLLFTKLDDLIKLKVHENVPFALIMFDIDHFKKINDRYGHLVGDDALVTLTKLIMDDKRSSDFIYRYGGEEFFLVLPNTDITGATKAAQRLHQLISELVIPKVGHITVSIGVVEYQSQETIDDVIKRVDDLMYQAKKAGRNQIKS